MSETSRALLELRPQEGGPVSERLYTQGMHSKRTPQLLRPPEPNHHTDQQTDWHAMLPQSATVLTRPRLTACPNTNRRQGRGGAPRG